jgi:hypothetical protein
LLRCFLRGFLVSVYWATCIAWGLGCGRQRLADGEEQMILFKEAGKTSHDYTIHTTGGG